MAEITEKFAKRIIQTIRTVEGQTLDLSKYRRRRHIQPGGKYDYTKHHFGYLFSASKAGKITIKAGHVILSDIAKYTMAESDVTLLNGFNYVYIKFNWDSKTVTAGVDSSFKTPDQDDFYRTFYYVNYNSSTGARSMEEICQMPGDIELIGNWGGGF